MDGAKCNLCCKATGPASAPAAAPTTSVVTSSGEGDEPCTAKPCVLIALEKLEKLIEGKKTREQSTQMRNPAPWRSHVLQMMA
eukprot:5926479-Amphidinium_carterae.1